MRKIEEICSTLKNLKPEIRKNFKVKELGVFGSYISDEQNADSDLDILVTFEEPVGFKFLELEEYLSEALGIKVDLVSKKALKPRIGKRILEKVIMV